MRIVQLFFLFRRVFETHHETSHTCTNHADSTHRQGQLASRYRVGEANWHRQEANNWRVDASTEESAALISDQRCSYRQGKGWLHNFEEVFRFRADEQKQATASNTQRLRLSALVRKST